MTKIDQRDVEEVEMVSADGKRAIIRLKNGERVIVAKTQVAKPRKQQKDKK